MKTIKRTRLVAAVAYCFGAAALATSPAHAQQSQKVEKIEVTGSNIKRVDSETVAPIQVITRDDIERSAKSIKLSAQVKTRFAIAEDSMTPAEFIQRLLKTVAKFFRQFKFNLMLHDFSQLLG
jgi:NAD-specific glutamate dehydrogenase